MGPAIYVIEMSYVCYIKCNLEAPHIYIYIDHKAKNKCNGLGVKKGIIQICCL